MTELEQAIIRVLQVDLPIAARPYGLIADRLGISEGELLNTIQKMLDKGVIRNIGAVVHHRRIGYCANALCVWKVPSEQVEEVGELFSELPVVTHCYERQTYPDWAYNLYTMVHAMSREECAAHIRAMSKASGICDFQMFYSTQELKKTSMRYFD